MPLLPLLQLHGPCINKSRLLFADSEIVKNSCVILYHVSVGIMRPVNYL